MHIGIGPPGLVHPSLPSRKSPSPRVGYHCGAELGNCAGGSFPRNIGNVTGCTRTFTGWSTAVTGCTFWRRTAADPLIEAQARAQEFAAATRVNVDVVLLEGANHYFDGRHRELAACIVPWLSRGVQA
jgi:hypothetical protein